MENKQIDPLITELITKALANEQTVFQLIANEGMWKTTRAFIRGTKKVIKLFKSLTKNSELMYCEQIKAGKQDLELLLARIQFGVCTSFYQRELEIAQDMLKEYNAYVFGGHLLKTICGVPRAEKDMVDYRTLPWRLF